MNKRKIRVETTSRICNLLFEEMLQDRLKERIKAKQANAAFASLIDLICGREDEGIALAERDGIDGGIEQFLADISSAMPDSVDTIEAISAGDIEETDCGDIKVTYDESGLLGTDCKTVVSFSASAPERIVVHRIGTADASLTFDGTTPRVICMYQTDVGPLSITVLTHRVINGIAALLEGADSAELIMDYTLEMGGAKTEFCHYEMKLVVEDD